MYSRAFRVSLYANRPKLVQLFLQRRLERMVFGVLVISCITIQPFFQGKGPKLILLDFGASRPYRKKFIDKYLQIIKAAVDREEEKVLQYSREIGFLTDYDAKVC